MAYETYIATELLLTAPMWMVSEKIQPPSAIADMSTTSAAAVAAVIFLERDKGPPARPEVLLIHMYRTTMHTMDTAITMMVAGAQ